MSTSMFSPEQLSNQGSIVTYLERAAHYILIACMACLPVLFIPGVAVSLGHTKMFVVSIGVALALLAYTLAFLRSGSIRIQTSGILIAVWGIFFASLVSALFSGDLYDSFIGSSFALKSVVGIGLMALIVTLSASVARHKQRLMHFFLVLLAATGVLVLFHLVRVLFGPEVLSFGLFASATSSPSGTWNDLAVLLGLVIILAMVALEQLPLSRAAVVLVSSLVAASLALLLVVNFALLWTILGLISLFIIVYGLTYQRFSPTPQLLPQQAEKSNVPVIFVAGLVFIVSFINVIGGGMVSSVMTNVTGINYIEVRPSLAATLDITRGSLGENALLGVGPDRFADAWRTHKDVSLNETIFWNTSFNAGSGFIPTSMLETGLLGIVAWISFLGLILYSGIRTLISVQVSDRMTNFLLITSFSAAVYLWLMALLYVPTVTVVLLAAAMTGFFIGIQSTLRSGLVKQFEFGNNRRAGFILVASGMFCIITTISASYYVGQHFFAAHSFAKTVQAVVSLDDIPAAQLAIASSFEMVPDDRFARQSAFYELTVLTTLLSVAEPTVAEQERFQAAVANSINAAQLAVASDPSDPSNWNLLGQIYSRLAEVGIDGASDRSSEAYAEAKRLDPVNPLYTLLEAQLASISGDVDGARDFATAAISQKRNYTDALFFLTQLEIAAGNVEEAIAATNAIVRLEPQNPARYYQLGVLQAAAENYTASRAALEEALRLNPEFANARYYLGLVLFQEGNVDEALAAFQVIVEANPDNQNLKDTIAAIETGDLTSPLNTAASSEPTENSEPVEEQGEQVTVTDESETDLISTINTVPTEELVDDEEEVVTEETTN